MQPGSCSEFCEYRFNVSSDALGIRCILGVIGATAHTDVRKSARGNMATYTEGGNTRNGKRFRRNIKYQVDG